MLIEATTQTVYGNVYVVGGNDDVNVGVGVTITSLGSSPNHDTEYDAITTYMGQHTFTVSGTINGFDEGINTIGCETAQTVEITATGRINSGFNSGVVDADGVILDGLNSTLVNRGVIDAQGSGAMLSTKETGTTVVTNYGTIMADKYGIWVQYSYGTASFFNYGRVESGLGSYLGGSKVDLVTNAGTMVGDIHFGQGNDVYVSTGGKVIGTIYGEWGDDRFVAGRAADHIDGGDGIDTLDFSSAIRAVKVDLSNAANNAGLTALHDTYAGIENVAGSALNDVLTGDAQANLLLGNAGHDMLVGADGNDTLVGGLGSDTVTGGNGFDTFVFNSINEIGGQIKDYSHNADVIALEGSAFGYGDYQGAIDAADFLIGKRSAVHDATDHFIFRTTDATLWYDADGNGGVASVMVANLNDDATLTFENIVII